MRKHTSMKKVNDFIDMMLDDGWTCRTCEETRYSALASRACSNYRQDHQGRRARRGEHSGHAQKMLEGA